MNYLVGWCVSKLTNKGNSEVVASIIAYVIEISQIVIGLAFFAFVLMFAWKVGTGG